MISHEKAAVPPRMQVVAKLYTRRSKREKVATNKDKRETTRAKSTVHSCRLSLSLIRVSLPAARLSRMPTRKRRNIALAYYRYSRWAQAYATRSGKGKIRSRRRRQQPDDEDQEGRRGKGRSETPEGCCRVDTI